MDLKQFKPNFDTWSKTALVIWVLLLSLCIPAFIYIAQHPSVLLWVEANQPAQGIERGNELIRQGRFEEAFYEMNRAVEFWQNLYAESEKPAHKIHLSQAKAALASAYARYGNNDQKQRALTLFEVVVQTHPDLSQGQPWLDYANLHLNLGNYQQAIEKFTHALEIQYAPVCTHALKGRGRAYLELNQPEKAAQDWVRWLPFASISEPEIITLLKRLQECASPPCLLVQAAANLYNEQTLAVEFLQEYLENNPANPLIHHWLSQISDHQPPHDQGEIQLNRLFPYQKNKPVSVNRFYLILYVRQSGPAEILLTLSSQQETSSVPELTLKTPNQTHTVFVGEAKPVQYALNIELDQGENLIEFIVPPPRIDQPQPNITLHKIVLDSSGLASTQ